MASESYNQIKKLQQIDGTIRSLLNEALFIIESLSDKYNTAFAILCPEKASDESIVDIPQADNSAVAQPVVTPPAPIQPTSGTEEQNETPSTKDWHANREEIKKRYEQIKREILLWEADKDYSSKDFTERFNLISTERSFYFEKLKKDKVVQPTAHGYFKISGGVPKKAEAMPNVNFNGTLTKEKFLAHMLSNRIVGRTSNKETTPGEFWERFEHIGTEVEDLLKDKNSYFKLEPK